MRLRNPIVNKTVLDATNLSSLQPEASLEQALISGDSVGLQAPSLSIEGSVFERVVLTEAKLEKLGLLDVDLKACDLSAAYCSESSIIRARF